MRVVGQMSGGRVCAHEADGCILSYQPHDADLKSLPRCRSLNLAGFEIYPEQTVRICFEKSLLLSH